MSGGAGGRRSQFDRRRRHVLTFPLLYAALASTATAAVVANGTNTVALVPAAMAALFGYRREIRHEWYWAPLLLPSLVGGLIGSTWSWPCRAIRSKGPCRG